jgi:hypothetical protein
MMAVFGVGASPDDELSFVLGFADLDGKEVLAAALEASHLLPPDRVEALIRQAGRAIGAVEVSMWLIDYGQAFLMPTIATGRRRAVGRAESALAVAGTAAGRVFATAATSGVARTESAPVGPVGRRN